MNKLILAYLILVVTTAGCGFGAGIADDAPPTLELYKVRNLTTWPNDTNYYSDGSSFVLYIKSGSDYQLRLQENGIDFPRFNQDVPANSNHAAYVDTSLEKDAAGNTAAYEIIPEANGLQQGAVHTYTLVEQSNKPQFIGLSQPTSRTAEIQVITITKPATIDFFKASFSSGHLNMVWRVSNCKKVQLAVNGAILDEQTVLGYAETFNGSKSIIGAYGDGYLKLIAFNALGQAVEYNLYCSGDNCYPLI